MSVIDQRQLELMDRYWNAANYLTVGQIYLQDNVLLKEPLRPEHIKPRLLGHWGTSPGLSFIYVHMNRLIQENNVSAIYLAGPGHGGPALVASAYLEGTYSEIYPEVSEDEKGLHRLFRQFSTPGGIPSHVSVPTPGSIHEGGELGYVLSHAFGAIMDNPDLLAVAVIGDGEAETAPLEGAWKSVKFINPARDGAVLPILHLNGYKIAGPTVLGREEDDQIRKLLEGHGYEVFFVEGDDPMTMHKAFAEVLDTCYGKIREYQIDARTNGFSKAPFWPAIVLRTPKGWTGPGEVDGTQVIGTFRAHQVPVSEVKQNASHLRILEQWLRSYKPEEIFDENGHLKPELAALAPQGELRMSANPAANGGSADLPALDVPEFRDYALAVTKPGTERYESTRQLGKFMRDIFTRNAKNKNFRLFCPDETNSNRLGNVFEVENRCSTGKLLSVDDHVTPDGRVLEVLSEHLCQGWLEGYLLTGRNGLFATYEAFAMVSASMTVQHAKWLQESLHLSWRKPIPSLNILLTSTCWRNDHNGFSHQGPGLIDIVLSKKGNVARIYLPPDANSLLSISDHCFRSHNYVNLIVIDKQPQLQWMSIEEAFEHCNRGLSIWKWASNDDQVEPDVVLACAGDVPTLETVAAAWWLRQHLPELKVRVVNVVDLMTLYPPAYHPHGLSNEAFVENFTEDKPVVFAFHGYQRAIHELIHGRPNTHRFHVRGFVEEGTTTTPFDMVVRNGMSRYHLCIEALKHAKRVRNLTPGLIAECEDLLVKHESYVRTNLEDMPEVRDWVWTD
ncbi:phosphoketolase family protein [Tengunoibacter tsumagoiensis]|uniref:Putative phosphoketolase n=1 Tax=Tengunoibacter tsumagoiensis TaxID=2014871 RepID=A0A402A9P5_9CHLR|nr:phosphoketolase family protein [Tengunoibacter tsumagoiensis]GCE15873.1 putative phosphoketolase [Tengunoibacter tsumagoiensis]